jgi:hypothetical protein
VRPLYKDPGRTITFTDYDVARRLLVSSVGGYCAYCEAPVSSDLPVEHKIPQAWVPEASTAWYNLLPACQSCNSAKGAKPRGGTAGPPAEQRFQASMALQLWPDSTPALSVNRNPFPAVAGSDTYRAFSYVKAPRSQVTLATPGAADNGVALLPPLLNASLSAAWATQAFEMVWVEPNPALPAATRAQALNTITCLALNRYNSADPGFNDRRTLNRTHTWTTAQLAAAAFTAQLGQLPAPVTNASIVADPQMNLLIRVTRQCALATGFWSVWMTVFNAEVAKPAWATFQDARQELICRLFLTKIWPVPPDAAARQALPTVFPGTDLNRIF